MQLELKHVSGGYGGKTVLEDISLTVSPGEIVTVLGPNGSGKSTLLRFAGGLRRPTDGKILVNGNDIRKIPSGKLARMMTLLPQTAEIPEGMTVEEMVSLGRFPYRESYAASMEKVRSALTETGSTDLAGRQVGSLSGGERQKARFAMVLAQSAEMLLLDEPTTHLDAKCQFEIMELIRRINRERNLSVLLVLHDLSLASMYSDRLIFLKDRKIRFSGTPEEMMRPEIIRDIFGIEVQTFRVRDRILCLATGHTPAGAPVSGERS